MRDSARFHFGFTVPYRPHPTCLGGDRGGGGLAGRPRHLPARSRRLGRVRRARQAPWWEGLVGEGRPKVIARLPFIERPTHPAGTPVFVVANPLDDPAAAQRDWVLHAARLESWSPESARALQDLYGEVVARAAVTDGHRLLLAVPGGVGGRQLREVLERTGASVESLDEIGSHAARFRV